MFKENETQYCPMCEEWAEKCNKLKAENKELKRKNSNKRTSLKKKQLHITQLTQTLTEIKEIVKIMNPDCEYEDWACIDNDSFDCAGKSCCPREIKFKILQKCEVIDE